MEPILSAPDNLKESNLGILAYFKPGEGLTMLRNQILGPERFDFALRTYIDRWAYKHPTPDDFFRTIENVSGEDLNWFWRSWFINNWQFDQAISTVKYVKNDPKEGAIVTIENLQKMPLPVIAEVKTKSGKVTTVKLPVEIWERNIKWSFKIATNEEIESVTLDPNRVFPDINPKNNTWKAGSGEAQKKTNLKEYLGVFGSKQIPLKITFTEENGVLMGQATGQSTFPLEDVGNDKFNFEEGGIEIQFNASKKEMTITQGGNGLLFTKE